MPPFFRRAGLSLCAVLALALVTGRPARAQAMSICARPDVLSFALDRLRLQDTHIALVPNSVVEVATTRSDVVLCALSVQVDAFDSFFYRQHPAGLIEPRYFEARTLGSGFVLDFSGK